MSQFNDIHVTYFGNQRAPQYGYPDCGSGWYSKKLEYKDWFRMNCGQRVQQNTLETLTTILFLTVVTGLVYPTAAFVLQIILLVSRLLFTMGYVKKGPAGRLPGAIPQNIAFFVVFGYALFATKNLI